jgi:hypothetical protein
VGPRADLDEMETRMCPKFEPIYQTTLCHNPKDNYTKTGIYCYVPNRTHKISNCSVGTATGYCLDVGGVGVRVPVKSRTFTSPYRPYEHRGPP